MGSSVKACHLYTQWLERRYAGVCGNLAGEPPFLSVYNALISKVAKILTPKVPSYAHLGKLSCRDPVSAYKFASLYADIVDVWSRCISNIRYSCRLEKSRSIYHVAQERWLIPLYALWSTMLAFSRKDGEVASGGCWRTNQTAWIFRPRNINPLATWKFGQSKLYAPCFRINSLSFFGWCIGLCWSTWSRRISILHCPP